jgi:hypothetical protein
MLRKALFGNDGTMIKSGIVLGSICAATAALAAANTDSIRLADNIVPAPFGYEASTGQYVVAEPTNVYISPYIYPGTVNNTKLMPGQPVDVLAKVKDYDWVLVGKDGVGVGYIPISRLSPMKR